MMRKLIAVLLSSCLIFQTAIYAENVTTEEKTVESKYSLDHIQQNRLDFMKKIGVLEDISESDISENRYITRGEFAHFAVGLYGDIYDSYMNSDTVYNDVDEELKYAKEINLLHSLDIVSGYDNQTYMPENNISINEVAKILTSIMGYTTIAEMEGGYPGGYIKAAYECSLFDGIDAVDFSQSLTISHLITIMFNALEATPLVFAKFVGNNMELLKSEDDTLLSQYFDIYQDTGVVNGNNQTCLLGKRKAGVDSVLIDDSEFYDPNNITENYLGYNIDFYYKSDENENEIVWLEPNKKSKITKLLSDEISAEDTTSYSIGYYVGSRSKHLELKDDVSVIYNGIEYSGFTAELFKNVDGDFTAISWDGGTEIDVLIVNDYEYYIIDKVDSVNALILDKFNRKINLEENIEDVIIVNESGEPVSLEDLKEWDGLAYQKSIDGEHQKLIVLKKHVEGTVDSYRTSSDEDNLGVVTVDGLEYKISKNYAENAIVNVYPISSISTSRVGYFVMDMNNKIILIDMNRDEYSYGILKKIILGDDQEGVFAKIFNSQGEHKTYKLADRVNIDSKIIKSVEYNAIVNVLMQGDVISSVTDAEKQADVDWYNKIPVNNVFQLIRYKIDEESEEITKIDTGYTKNEREAENLRLMYDINTSTERGAQFMFKSGSGLLSGVLAPSNAPIFFVPSPLEIDNTDAYTIKNSSYFSNDGNYTLLPYGISDESAYRLEACVMIDSYKVNMDSASWFMVTDKNTVLFNDEVVSEITGYAGKTLTVHHTEKFDLFDDINKGDIVQLGTDTRGFIDTVQKIYDVKERDLTAKGKESLSDTAPNVQKRYICADVVDVFNELISVSNVYIGGGKLQNKFAVDVTKQDLTEKFNATLFKNKRGIVVYDVEEETVTVNETNDIRPYAMYGNDCSRIVIHTAYSEAQSMFVYNY